MISKNSSIQTVPVVRVNGDQGSATTDTLAIEEPLEIRIAFGAGSDRTIKNIAVTMRTPGNDAELATGFVFTEGIITGKADLASVNHWFIACAENKENVIQVELNKTMMPQLKNAERNFYTTSSCGVCGKGSIDSIKTVSRYHPGQNSHLFINRGVLLQLPDRLRQHQESFNLPGSFLAAPFFLP